MKCGKNTNRDIRSNPALFAGLCLNCIVLLIRHIPDLSFFQSGWPLDLLCFGEGMAIGLMLVGLVLLDPKRAEAIRDWKKEHLPFLVRD